MSRLTIEGLHASIGGKDILRGIDLDISGGEVHAVMGPNGSGKSTLSYVLMGRPGYEVTDGSVTLDGQDLLALSTWERAQAGLFLAMQYPVAVDGVAVVDVLEASLVASGRPVDDLQSTLEAEAAAIGFAASYLERSVNVDFSGGEMKRNETLQLMTLRPKFAILDEIDSGLDIDALAAVSRRIEQATNERGLGILAITHYSRLLHELRPDRVHVLSKGVIQASGGPELAEQLEVTGYSEWVDEGDDGPAASSPLPDPFADPLS